MGRWCRHDNTNGTFTVRRLRSPRGEPPGPAMGSIPARSSRLTRIITRAMTTARIEIPADTRYPRPNPKARAWLDSAVCAACVRCAPWVAVIADFVFDATADQATVPRIASPIDPPTCCPVLSSDDATPESLFGTLASATRDN